MVVVTVKKGRQLYRTSDTPRFTYIPELSGKSQLSMFETDTWDNCDMVQKAVLNPNKKSGHLSKLICICWKFLFIISVPISPAYIQRRDNKHLFYQLRADIENIFQYFLLIVLEDVDPSRGIFQS